MENSQNLETALSLHRKGDFDGAEKIYRSILEKNPDCSDGLHLLGLLKRQCGKPAEAMALLEKSCLLGPTNGRFFIDFADCLSENKAFEKALYYYRQASIALPADGSIPFKMASIHFSVGDVKAARECLQKTLSLDSRHIDALFNLAELLRMEKEYSQAVLFVERALALKPAFAKGHYCAGLIYQGLGNFEKALVHFQEAIRIDDGDVAAHIDLGNVLHATGRVGAAITSYRSALSKKPDSYEAYFNLANCLRETDHIDDAILCFQAALKLNPSSIQGLANYGEALLTTGHIVKAEQCFSQAVKLSEGKCSQAFSNLLLCLNYNPEYSPKEIFEKHCEFGRITNQFINKITVQASPSSSDILNSPQFGGLGKGALKKLRIGYVSPDFCNHPAARFLEPVLANHDMDEFDIFCYSDVAKPDTITERFKNAVRNWKEIHGKEDDRVEATIREDQIDILVDCCGHTAGNRQPLFAKKPAPIQISYLGYPATTGLKSMDYYITDAILDQPDDASFYTEKLLKIDSCFCCFSAYKNAPDVNDLPAARNGFITFGSFHTLARLNYHVIELWIRLLKEIPGSRLRIVRNTLNGSARANLESKFLKSDIDPQRIDLSNEIPGAGHLSLYHGIDILLDTFPWSGHTTACESLWMGVPVVTLYGGRHAGRMVSSILETMGLGDWVARSTEEYLGIAKKQASSIDELISLRTRLREAIATSEVCNAKSFTRKLEAVYRKIWS